MKFEKLFKYIVYITFFIPVLVFADSPVWKVSKGDNVIFIGGTVHILSQSDYPLPGAFDKAYAEAEKIIFETDIGGTQTPEFQQKVLQVTLYPSGTTLKDFLTPETYQRLETYCASNNIQLAQLIQFRPGMLSVTLTVIELQKLGLAGTGVDQYFNLRAINEGKAVGYLESIDEQLAFLANMGEGHENELISGTLRDLAELSTIMSDIKAAWRKGDLQGLDELISQPMKKETPKIYTQIVSDRNANWLPQLEAMFANDSTELVLVGMLHLVGEDGLLHQLKAKGYTLEKLK